VRCPLTAARLFPVLLCGLLLAGCSSGLSDPWTGQWQGSDERVLKITADDKVELQSNGVVRATGKFTRLSSQAAQIELTSTAPGPSGTPASRTQIIKLDDSGRSFSFNRVKYSRPK
jgi:hypothetical protein